ncbi:unnamed protein product [Acanthoscelides obtectus]|uniref:Uncharacterized protein n=1 Tax=Acanthoscelides obtectus TaxID=200917 RepID=A0A9P0LIS7_ACAOB|nr:unnamed protein product [Acanthoscelides obtectus]CAK1680675.1 hypothetical protein AOBTE_LOCUS32835 [Acanthoscelides obtectus]
MCPLRNICFLLLFFRYSSVIFPIKIRIISRNRQILFDSCNRSLFVPAIKSFILTVRRVHSLSGAENRIVIRLRGKHLEV